MKRFLRPISKITRMKSNKFDCNKAGRECS